MSLNLGNDAIEAARQLQESPQWRIVRDALLEASRRAMNVALEVEPAKQPDAVGYARALRDIYTAFESATTGQRINAIEKPGPVGKLNAAR